ncbi:hypothetical protein [Polymorphospora rubra]|uniref:Uncharacterized protein n=1 Tax=Polymorphospora rubra TaxID=338584 RepID=A0A810MX30_9ACTN|nr:hypothetical protein [Polymorphospora rubra]BCJ64163.1 hypothetical protein Prubr_11840 [Polymorphospora rubra]
MTETPQQRWTRRLRDAAIEATLAGVSEAELRAALDDGLAEGRRGLALRRGELPAPPTAARHRAGPVAPPGSAAERLLKATGIIP